MMTDAASLRKTSWLAGVICLVAWTCYAAETAVVTLNTNELIQTYSGQPLSVGASTVPTGLVWSVTYNGETSQPVNAGYYTVVAMITETGWEGAATNTLSVTRATPVITFSLPATAVATQQLSLTASSTSGQPVSFDVQEGPGMITNAILSFTNEGIVSVTAACAGDFNWQGAAKQMTVTVSRAQAVVTLSGCIKSYTGRALAPDVITTPAGLPVVLTYDPTGTPVNVGTYAVTAQVSSALWTGGTAGPFEIVRGTRTVSFANPGIQALNATTRLVAAGSSGVSVTNFYVTAGSATITNMGALWYAICDATGRVQIAASQSGDSNWLDAVAVTNTFWVYDQPVFLSTTNLNVVYSGNPYTPAILFPDGSGVTSNDLVITYDGSAVAPSNAGSCEMTVLITNGASGGVIDVVTIAKADDAVIDFNAPAGMVVTQQIELTASSASGLSCGFQSLDDTVAAVEGGSNLVGKTAGQVGVYAYTLGDDNWNAVTGFVQVTVSKATASLVFETNALTQTYSGSNCYAVVNTTPTGLPLVLTYNGSTDPALNAGVYAVTATVSHAMYEGTMSAWLYVDKAAPTVQFPDPGAQWTTSMVVLAATASNGDDPVFSVTAGSAYVQNTNQLYFTGASTVSVVAVLAETANWLAQAVTNRFAVERVTAQISLSPPLQFYDGTPRPVTASYQGGTLKVRYDGSTNVPSACGVYALSAAVNNDYYTGAATGKLTVIIQPSMRVETAPVPQVLWEGTNTVNYTVQQWNPADPDVWDNVSQWIAVPGTNGIMSMPCPQTAGPAMVYRVLIEAQQ